MNKLTEQDLAVRITVTGEQWQLLFTGLTEAQALPDPDVFVIAHIAALKRDLGRLAAEKVELQRELTARLSAAAVTNEVVARKRA
jgi:hypothetical protein